MMLSTQTAVLAHRLGDAEAIRTLARVGYDAYDYSMFTNPSQEGHPLNGDDSLAYARELRQVADQAGIPCNQAHAPFPSYIAGNDAYNAAISPLIDRAVAFAAVLGAKSIVVHPIAVPDPDRQLALNLDLYHRLQPLCEQLGIKVALENMWGRDSTGTRIVPNVCSTGESFADYLDRLDSRYFTACLDLGHCGLVGEDAAAMIRQLGHDRLQALHVHDNNGLEDTHTAPFMSQMDFGSITKALADIQYSGEMTLESDNFLKGFPDEFLETAARFMHDIGRQLIRMVEQAGR